MRRVILTPKVIEQIKDLLKKGTPIRYIAEEVGMNPVTYYRWIDRAERLEEQLYKGELKLSEIKNKTYCMNLINLLASVRDIESNHYETMLDEFQSVLEMNPSAERQKLHELTREALKGHYE